MWSWSRPTRWLPVTPKNCWWTELTSQQASKQDPSLPQAQALSGQTLWRFFTGLPFSENMAPHTFTASQPCLSSALTYRRANASLCKAAASTMPFSTGLPLAPLSAEPYPGRTGQPGAASLCTPASLISLLLPGFLDLAPLLLSVRGQHPLHFTGHSFSLTSAVLSRMLNKQKTYRHLPRDIAATSLFCIRQVTAPTHTHI